MSYEEEVRAAIERLDATARAGEDAGYEKAYLFALVLTGEVTKAVAAVGRAIRAVEERR